MFYQSIVLYEKHEFFQQQKKKKEAHFCCYIFVVQRLMKILKKVNYGGLASYGMYNVLGAFFKHEKYKNICKYY